MATKPVPQPRRPSRRAASGAVTANGKAPSSSKPTSPVHPSSAAEPERTVKKLRLARALTLPEATPVSEACRRMAARRVDAALLTDANGMLSGILTAEDIAGRVIAEGLKPEETFMAKVMTRNPVFVMSNSSAIEALQKMVQAEDDLYLERGTVVICAIGENHCNEGGSTRMPIVVVRGIKDTKLKVKPGKFRHLPVVEHGEVIAMVDIKKFLYDAISRMEKAAEQGSAIAAAMEGVERQCGNDFPGPHAFMESLREQMFKPSLSTVITENSCVPVVSPSDPVTLAAKKMREHRVNSVVVMTGNVLLGILTSKDLVLRVLAQNLSADATLVEKAMTANPDYATLDTSILDALHSMQDGKFLHIPVIIACLDALQLAHAAISMVEGTSGANDLADSMMQKFWDSALAMHPAEEFDARSDESRMVGPDSADGKHVHPPHVNSHSVLKLKTEKGVCTVSESLDELVSAVAYRLGTDAEKSSINLLYDDDEGDRVLLTSDSDLTAAIQHAKSAGWKVLRLHMDNSQVMTESTVPRANPSATQRARTSLRFGIAAGAVAVAGVAVIFYLKRSQL